MLSALPRSETPDPNLLVGFDTADDAAVYRVSPDIAIIQTVDFFPPMVDDPYAFGQVAAANALSDIYAMGGAPKLALNLFCFPSNKLSKAAIQGILMGGADKVLESGATLCGGHTIEDPEPKYGLAVTGFVHPDKMLPNSSAKEGDLLILTKPIGSGVLTTAAKAGLLDDEAYKGLIKVMTTLNSGAQKAMLNYKVNSCTDITGFGLLGHLREMAEGSGLTAELIANDVPLMEAAIPFANMGIIPGGAYRNREFAGEKVLIAEGVKRYVSDLLFDPQTSGGLLISLPEKDAFKLLDDIRAIAPETAIIGRMKAKAEKAIEVI